MCIRDRDAESASAVKGFLENRIEVFPTFLALDPASSPASSFSPMASPAAGPQVSKRSIQIPKLVVSMSYPRATCLSNIIHSYNNIAATSETSPLDVAADTVLLVG
eukprot:8989103-Pyramimonas_sp.AAC.1